MDMDMDMDMDMEMDKDMDMDKERNIGMNMGIDIQGGALNRGLLFADPPPSLLGAVSGNISEKRWAAA
jgi:hypothetical protein